MKIRQFSSIQGLHAVVCPTIVDMMFILVYTSSTARGRGGSFKNRKPMGEIGCCESRMAEQKQ